MVYDVQYQRSKSMPTICHVMGSRETNFFSSPHAMVCSSYLPVLQSKESSTFSLPETFPQYFQLLLTLTSHSSLFIASSCTESLVVLLRALRSPTHQQFVTDVYSEVIEVVFTKIHKVRYS